MIQLNSINKIYITKSGSYTALNDINIILYESGLVILKGKSGSGKTTLLNVIAGLEKVSSGSIIYDCKEENDQTIKDSIGYVFQDVNLFDSLTVMENINIYKNIDWSYLEKLIKELGLVALKDKKVKYLSGGEKRRVAIARALIKKPKILLCDEPTASLDKENASIVYNILKEYSKDNLVIVSNHNEDLFKQFDMLINLEYGNIISTEGCTAKKDSNIQRQDKSVNERFIKKVAKEMLVNNKLNLSLNLLLLVICVILINFFVSVTTIDYSETQISILNHEKDNVLKFRDKRTEYLNVLEGNTFMQNNDPLHIDFNYTNIDNYYYGGILNFLTFYKCDSRLVGNNYLGNIPTSSNEIMIYQILAEHIIYYGIKDEDGKIIKPNKINDLIGLDIEIAGERYIIKGIIEQNLGQFDDLKKTDINSESANINDLLLRKYYSDDILSYNHLILVNDECYEKMLEKYEVNNTIGNDYFLISDDYDTVKSVLDGLYRKPDLLNALNHPYTFYIDGTRYSEVLTYILYKPYCFSLIFKFALPLLLAIMIILIFIFFYNTFLKNKNKISVLISLGFSNKTINKTIFYSMILYMSFVLIVGLTLSYSTLYCVNAYLNGITPFYLRPFKFKFFGIVVVVLAISMMSYALLSRANSRMKISQNIRNN